MSDAATFASYPSGGQYGVAAFGRRVGQRLLERSPRDVKPTAAGNVLLPYAYKVLSVDLAARVALNVGNVSCTVKLGILEDIAVGHLPHALRQFAGPFPQVALEIVVDGSPALSQCLANQELDIAIGDPSTYQCRAALHLAASAARAADSELRVEPLPIVAFGGTCPWQDRFFAVLRRHPLARGLFQHEPVSDLIGGRGRAWRRGAA